MSAELSFAYNSQAVEECEEQAATGLAISLPLSPNRAKMKKEKWELCTSTSSLEILDLPNVIVEEIASLLDPKSLCCFGSSCRQLRKLAFLSEFALKYWRAITIAEGMLCEAKDSTGCLQFLFFLKKKTLSSLDRLSSSSPLQLFECYGLQWARRLQSFMLLPTD